jgi:3-phenylpropionate/trans-cinnamate dioxygenase ferredoxin reductase subunit
MARAVTAEIRSSRKPGTPRPASAFTSASGHQHRADGTKVTGVSLSDGRHIPVDLVVVGVGVLPNVELAAAAGLPVASGVIVDDHLSTSDPNISAVGDCALFASPRFGGSLRLNPCRTRRPRALRRRAADRQRKSL